ncbi:MAG: hypothetical protein QOH81_2836 [Sphingomonadales bacterium]|jgi:hypothetical protein|nr:hypothetical protein [Sphingomonadales bacterium]
MVGAAGALLVLLAAAAGPGWAERHFLPAWAWSWDVQLRIVLVLRILIALAGLLLILVVRPRLARGIEKGRGREIMFGSLSALLAVTTALAATEGVLRTRSWRSVQERSDNAEPRRVRDPILGWTFLPNHQGSVPLGGRIVRYATDAHGYRIAQVGRRIDVARPTIVFAGESILFGYGLEWPETIPAQLERMTGLQAADIAVNAYATDQIALRLRRELPRFARPVAVIVPFVPSLLDRNLDRDRPHLDADLRWHPAERPPLRLVELARRPLRYRSANAIREGVAMTRAALRAAIALARSRGAEPIILVPQPAPEAPRETAIRRMVLDAGHIPYLLVRFPAAWRVPGDRHPDARAARAIAAAVATVLAEKGVLKRQM